ncbi:MAG: diguanylate cyclase [Thiohalomonadaceae bacterium]
MPLRNLLHEDEKASVLVIDDAQEILQLLEITLSIDYEVVTACSGEQALEICKQRHFDLVLLDLLMPGINGFETLANLKKLPSFGSTPIIFLTAQDDLASECSALEMGADDYITKPFKPSLVRLRVANVIERIRLLRHLTLALASADLGLWSWNLASGQIRIADEWSNKLSDANGKIARRVQGWTALAHPHCQVRIVQARNAYLAGDLPVFEADIRLRALNGEWQWFNIYGKSDNHLSLFGTYQNINAKKTAELALLESEERLRLVMDATGEGVWDWRVNAPIISHNAAWNRMLGLTEKTQEHSIDFAHSLIHPDDLDAYRSSLDACLAYNQPFAIEYRMQRANGSYIWVRDHGKVVERTAAGVALRLVGAMQDISASKLLEEKYRRLALFDTLTGLPNRRLLLDRMEQTAGQSKRLNALGALLFIDIDRFKQLNDSLGHDYGDMMLIEVGHRLQSCVRHMDTVARLSGDEFIVMLPLLSTERKEALHAAQAIGNKILFALSPPYQLKEHSHHSTPSIGLTLFPSTPNEKIEDILKRADKAMYEAKRQGGNQLVIDYTLPQVAI